MIARVGAPFTLWARTAIAVVWVTASYYRRWNLLCVQYNQCAQSCPRKDNAFKEDHTGIKG